MNNLDEKQCPFCAETIKAAAIRCRYCSVDLPSLQKPPLRQGHIARVTRVAAKAKGTDNSFIFVVGLVILAGLMGGIFVFNNLKKSVKSTSLQTTTSQHKEGWIASDFIAVPNVEEMEGLEGLRRSQNKKTYEQRLSANEAWKAETGTHVSVLESKGSFSHVLALDGKFKGKDGWILDIGVSDTLVRTSSNTPKSSVIDARAESLPAGWVYYKDLEQNDYLLVNTNIAYKYGTTENGYQGTCTAAPRDINSLIWCETISNAALRTYEKLSPSQVPSDWRHALRANAGIPFAKNEFVAASNSPSNKIARSIINNDKEELSILTSQIQEAYRNNDFEAAVPLYKKSISIISRSGDKEALEEAKQNYIVLLARVEKHRSSNEGREQSLRAETRGFAPLASSGGWSSGAISIIPSVSRAGTRTFDSSRSAQADVDFGPYMADLQRRIKRAWFPPRGQESKRVKVAFKVTSGGTLQDLHLSGSSGMTLTDKAALDAVENAAPFRPLPAGAPLVVDIDFTFDYNVFR